MALEGELVLLGSIVDTAKSGEYPLSRDLFMFTLGEPQGEVKAYLDWILSPAGQKIVSENGFIPIN